MTTARSHTENFIGPVDDENANAADQRERKLILADHNKRISLVYSHLLLLITDLNLKNMIKNTPGTQFNCYRLFNSYVASATASPTTSTSCNWMPRGLRSTSLMSGSTRTQSTMPSSSSTRSMRSTPSHGARRRTRLWSSSFTPDICSTISMMCMVELSAAEADRRYWVSGVNGERGHRCWRMLHDHLEPIYCQMFKLGGIHGAHRSSTFNGAVLAGNDDFDEEDQADAAYLRTCLTAMSYSWLISQAAA